MQPTQQTPVQTASDRLAAMITPRRRDPEKPITEDHDYLLMLWRMVRALEARAIENPAMLSQVVALAQRLAEVVNVAIATSAERHKIDPYRAASMAECARALGISKQSASERRKLGDRAIADRLRDAGVARFSEAKRERAAIEAAAEFADAQLIDFTARYNGRHRQAS